MDWNGVNIGRWAAGVLFLLWVLVLSAPKTARGQTTAPAGQGVVNVTTAWRNPHVHAGERTVLAVVLDIGNGWHINADKAQIIPVADFQPIPTTLTVMQAPEALLLETPRFPPANPVGVNFTAAPARIAVFDHRAVIYLPVKVNATAKPGALAATLQLRYQACNDRICQRPMTQALEVKLQVVEPAADAGPTNSELFAGYDAGGNIVTFDWFGWRFMVDPAHLGGLALLLLVAAIGGALLNVTPCVLPMIPLKVMSLSRAAGNRSRCLLLGMAMSAGVVAFWLGLAGAVLLTRRVATAAGGGAGMIATNELFRHPGFTVGVGVVIAILAVGMCGLFSLRLPRWVYQISPRQETVAGSVGFGVMTAVLSTPCTAPLMGAAAAWAVLAPAGSALATFGAIGAGMALPYLLLSAFPALAARMPRSGPISELIKQVMGLFMLAAAAYFIGAGLSAAMVKPPGSPSLLYWWVVMGLAGAAGLWLALRGWRLARSRISGGILAALGLVIAWAAIHEGIRFTDPGPINLWMAYTPQHLQEAQAAGKTVVLDFTANWCLNCKALEEHVLKNPQVVARLRRADVAAMKVDLSGDNQPGEELLRRSGRSSMSIPWLTIIGPDGAVRLASEAYTAAQVDEALGGGGTARNLKP
jgi:thiol:disulfide interchange protein